LSSPNGDLWENEWRIMYNDLKQRSTEALKEIGQATIQILDEINQNRDKFGRLSQTDEIAYDDYAMCLDVITVILLERSVIL
jgi:hypothetical protein